MKRHSLPLPPPRELAQVISTRLLRTLARLTVDDVDGRAAAGGGGEWEGPDIHAGYFAGSVSAASGCNETCGAAWQWTVISACLAQSHIKCITLLITLNINTRMSKCQGTNSEGKNCL